jgi:hypothetical protein
MEKTGRGNTPFSGTTAAGGDIDGAIVVLRQLAASAGI